MICMATQAALAQKPWYYPRATSKSYVNPYLTPNRAINGTWQHRFSGQLVLWKGKASNIQRSGNQSLTLRTKAGNIPVKFSRRVKNLQADRDGSTVAIKGHVRTTSAGKVYLEGRSVIPWRPKGGFNADTPLIEQWVLFQRPGLSEQTRKLISRSIQREASSQGVDPLFLTALMQVESGFDPNAVSVSGARGLGQLMPATAAGLGVDPRDIQQNIRGSAKMVGNLVRRYTHRWDGKALVLASYNAGPTLVARIQAVPRYEQTINYVYFIGTLYTDLKRQSKRLRKAS